jgi:hypothetical protein
VLHLQQRRCERMLPLVPSEQPERRQDMTEREMTVEQEAARDDIRREYGGCVGHWIDSRGFARVIDGEGDHWQISTTGLRSLVATREECRS